MIFAATIQQNLGATIAVLAIIGWLIYVLSTAGRGRREVGSEIELAPNRKPYLDDDELETTKLDRTLAVALACLVVVGIGLPVYWLAEPGRMDGAVNNFDLTFAHRGEETYGHEGANAFNCERCHGPEGSGGVTDFVITDPVTGENRSVKWKAPALNTVLLRFSEDEVRDIINFGRANTPMPPWGVEGGGPMNEQQVSDLVAYLASIQLDPEEVQAQAQADAEAAVAQGTYASLGEALFALNCARCHTIGASYGEPGVQGGGAFGPNLREGSTVRQFPVIDAMIEFISKGTEANKAYGIRGIGSGRMPGFGQMLSEAQIRAIVEYERSL